MGAHPLIFAAVLLYFVQLGYCASPPVISFNPPTQLILTANQTQPGAGPPLTITCTQPVGGILVTLTLNKTTATGSKVTLLQALDGTPPDGTGGAPVLGSGITGATPSGSLRERFITLTFSQSNCDSGGFYTCSHFLLTTGQQSSLEASFNYSVTVSPGHVSLTHSGTPTGVSGFQVGDIVTFTCNAELGTVDNVNQVNFVWEYQDNSGSSVFKSFTTYPHLDDIDSKAAPIPNPNCARAQNKISTLTRNLTIEDSERQYKCYINKAGVSYENLAGFWTLDVVQDPDAPLTPGAGSQASSPTAKADAGMIVGIIIAILVVIAVVVVIVVFVIRRRNMKKQEGAYDPEKTEPTASAPPPYAPPEEVGYSQPRFSRGDKPRTGGHSNKAMEEPDDKPRDKERERDKEKEREKPRDKERDKERDKPRDGRQPRYANDYNDGRQNPAYERNVDDIRGVGRRPSSDDGGTDGNRSYLSLGEGDHTIGTAI